MKMTTVILSALLLAIPAFAHQDSLTIVTRAPTGEDVLARVDSNLVIDQATGVSTMIVHGRRGSRTITSRFWMKGRENTLVEYLSPPREKGKKMLKLGDKLWTYTPEPTDRIITIAGHLLRQSVMGSDLSYEDMMENESLVDLYAAQVEGREEAEGRACWVVHLIAETEDVAYHSRRVWVDMERWLPLREERYAKSGKLLKTTRITEVFWAGDRWYPRRILFKDMLSSGKGTEHIIDEIDFDVQIPDHKLTKAALRK